MAKRNGMIRRNPFPFVLIKAAIKKVTTATRAFFQFPSATDVYKRQGYRYIGYLSLDDNAISEIQHKDEGTKNVPVSETQVSIPNEAPKAEKPKYLSLIHI